MMKPKYLCCGGGGSSGNWGWCIFVIGSVRAIGRRVGHGGGDESALFFMEIVSWGSVYLYHTGTEQKCK